MMARVPNDPAMKNINEPKHQPKVKRIPHELIQIINATIASAGIKPNRVATPSDYNPLVVKAYAKAYMIGGITIPPTISSTARLKPA